jgi:hypothetical protein
MRAIGQSRDRTVLIIALRVRSKGAFQRVSVSPFGGRRDLRKQKS